MRAIRVMILLLGWWFPWSACGQEADPGLSGVVDRVEGRWAVLEVECGSDLPCYVDVPVSELPIGVGEGDVIVDGRLDVGARAALQAEIEARLLRFQSGDLDITDD